MSGNFGTVCTHTNLEDLAHYTHTLRLAIRCSLLLPGYKPIEHVTILNTAGNWNTMVSMCVSEYRKGTVKNMV